MPEGMGRNRELVLPPGTYAFVLDSTKGKVSTYVGPVKNSLSETDQLVAWDARDQKYHGVETTEQAIQTWALAEQGQYIVLANPAVGNSHPPKAQASDDTDLEAGRRVIVAGPATFPLWPGQSADTIDGHHLRHNQFVIVRVYDAQQAQENWQSAVMAPQVSPPLGGTISISGGPDGGEQPPQTPAAVVAPETVRPGDEPPAFTMGQLMVVPGTQVSFYMPSTGMEVVPDNGQYVRDAVTLETLEYCILLDENGQKRYLRGPAVVFPNPTETFKSNEDKTRIFDAIELNEQTGIYVKVIEEYDGHPVGEELFITGKEQAIYFPRAEHSIIMYSGRRKHHAIAVPAGEGRYVLNRNTGNVELKPGPTMLLPDPRFEVIVRRILDPHDVETMFPGNQEALQVNIGYASVRKTSADYLENAEMRSFAGAATNDSLLLASSSTSPGSAFTGDTLSRGSTYTPPRTITLDTKYEGAVAISVFPGYAVLVTNKTGERSVEVGPKVVLLDYDETIMALSLSTGRPKTDAHLLRTGYLRVINNVVSDQVPVETNDLVELEVGISYRVNFEGTTTSDQERWFDVENYVQVLTDHCRSRLRNLAKRSSILDFYTNAIDLIRDNLLGMPNEAGERPGLPFVENGMRIYDVEVLDLEITDTNVEKLLTGAKSKALSGAIELTVAEQTTARETKLEEFKRIGLEERQKTADAQSAITIQQIKQELDARIATLAGNLSASLEEQKIADLRLLAERAVTEQEIALQKELNETDMLRLAAETDEQVKRMGAFAPAFVEALTSFADRALMEKMVTAIGPAALAAGVTTGDMLATIFEGTSFEGPLKALTTRPLADLPGQE